MLTSLSLHSRVAVVTGASRNIGLATSRLFAEAGADLLMVARGRDRLEQAAQEIRRLTGRTVATVSADLSTPAGLQSVVDVATSEFATVDVLVNNAHTVGDGGKPHHVLDADWSVWEECFAINFKAPLHLSQVFGRRMTENGGGVIINVLSTVGFTPIPTFGPYGVTKAALWAMTRYMAKECGPTVRVNAVCPGSTADEDKLARATRGDAWKELMASTPLMRMGAPEETAAAMLYLASDASSYTTGQVLFVDGGRVSAAGAG